MGGNMRKEIEVFSTMARDVFVNKSGKIIKESQGGPATFIKQTLDDLGIEYQLNLTNEVTVEILLTAQGEYGRIITPPKQKQIKTKTGNNFILVSTLLNEWIPPAEPANIFLDIQGYVRDGNNFGGMKPFVINSELASKLTCVKAEKDEAQFLEKTFLEEQKMKQLVITKGSDGLDLYIAGNLYQIQTKTINGLPDTVGAGDTWFSAYVAYQLQGFNYLDSATMAVDYVCKFLERKKERKR